MFSIAKMGICLLVRRKPNRYLQPTSTALVDSVVRSYPQWWLLHAPASTCCIPAQATATAPVTSVMYIRMVRTFFRYRHLIETLGDLSLAADVDPDAAAALLNRSQAQDDIDTMLALLRAEERHNTRSEHGRSVSLSGGSGCGTVNGGSSNSGGGSNGGSDAGGCSQELLATPCLELLLEERIVKLLCELGVADKPRGTMAMVLGACASLLEQVRNSK